MRLDRDDFASDENLDRHRVWERAHELGSPTHRLRRSLVLSLAAKLPPSAGGRSKCLDAGCGTGEFVVELARRGWDVVGFDPSPYAIGLAAERAGAAGLSVELLVSNVETYEARDRFELILAVDVLEHVEDDAAALSRLAGYLHERGKLLLTVPADPTLWSSADEFSGHYRRYTFESMRELAGRSGLRVAEILSYGFPMTRLLWQVKRRAPSAETWVLGTEGNRGRAHGAAARSIAAAARAITSIDRLFTASARGVGLVALLERRG